MPLPGSQRTIYLKTVTGRQCAVAPPLTLRRLVDAAVGQLRLEPASVRLFVGGRPIFGCCPAADGQMGRQVSVPEDGIVLVVGRPALRKGSRPVKTETAEEEMEMEVDVGEGEKKGEGKEVADAPRATPRPQPQATVERSVGNKKSHPSPASPTIDDAMNIQSGDNDKGLYRFLKPLVFMLGRRGLHHLFMVARGHYGHLPESFQDHPVMVCIVDYVDRDPNRLKEILTTIQEEEPGFMRWIEAHAEFFLNVINTPPQWRDETSPIWLIRRAKRLYNMEAAKVNDQNGMMCAISPTDRYAELLSEDMTNTRISFDENILSTETELDESSTNIDLTSTISPGSIHSIPGIEGPINENISLEEDSCIDSSIQELQMVYRSWEIAKERYNTQQQNPIDVRGLEADVESKLCDVRATFLRIMETYIMIPPDLATLSKLIQTGEGAWNECEEWFINRGDSVNAFETALGKLLFYAERELFASYISAQQRQQRRRKSQSNSHLSVVDTLEQFPILDSTTRWMTVNGPSTLAHKLREYSHQESVSIVIYSQISSSSSSSFGQLYAYIITDGNVNIVPITSDDATKWELKELERIYDILAQTYPPKETIRVRRSILPRWTDLLGRLYQRLITPIRNFLPLPASKSHVPPSDVGQICFIDTWTPSHIPIPFPALWNPADKASCLLQWAVFQANRPWDLIHSAEISWSNHVAKSPVITRVVSPIVNPPPLSCTSEESLRSRKTMVTYVNTSDVGCASVEDTPPPPPSASATGECKQPNGVGSGGLWQNIPWENWMRKVLGTVRAGIPTYASIKGNDPARNRTTSLFIYETFFSNKYCESNEGGNDVLLSTHLMNNRAGRKISMRREPPYNQSADLFVSHVVGRNNGAGIHRAALLPSFKVAGREPVETYMCFLKALVATDDMTAAKAYRLSLLLSWQTDCREEPWRSTSLTLYNYGGKMNTLQFLHEEYSKKRFLKVLRMSGNKATRPNEVTEEQQESARQLRNRSVVRDTADGRYVEDHGIDDIYNVVLRSLSTTRPQGEAAILDNMIQCIERNRSALEECVEKHREGKEISRQVLDTHVDSISPPSATTNRGSSFVASMRNMITASRNNVPDNTSTELPVRSRGPPSGNQPPNGRKPPSGNLK